MKKLKFWTLIAFVFCILLSSCIDELGEKRQTALGYVDYYIVGDYSYELNSKGVTIIGYRGNGGHVILPNIINGRPVTAIDEPAGYHLTNTTRGVFSSNHLTGITFGNNITAIGDGVFSDNQLTSVTIPNSVTTIGYSAFSDNQLTSVVISDSVSYLNGFCFSGNQLTSVTIPNSVTTIGQQAFSGNQLTSITIGVNVSINWDAFSSDDDWDYSFTLLYDTNGKLAGTYTRPNTSSRTWTRQ